VVIDALPEQDGLTAEAAGDGVLRLRLRQTFTPPVGDPQRISSEAMAAGG
jgi:hypothetical protein